MSSARLSRGEMVGQWGPGRSDVQLVEIGAAKSEARRIRYRQPDFALQTSSWVVSGDPSTSSAHALQAALAICGQAVGNALPCPPPFYREGRAFPTFAKIVLEKTSSAPTIMFVVTGSCNVVVEISAPKTVIK